MTALRAKRRGAKQKLREFAALSKLVARHRPRVVVEIGTMHGGTLWAWCQLAASDAMIVSIDLPGGSFGGGYPQEDAPKLENHAHAEQRVVLIRDDSHLPSTLDHLRLVLAGRPIDLLFIDGDHSYEGVRQDHEMYGPLVGRPGLIVFHDILGGRLEDGEVSRYWSKLRARGRHVEFVDVDDIAWRGPWGGIGVLVT